ncbi:hypothetical protein [Micromonospora chersina]|uniref:hypothetical protein n=1 Tax=Micromonospora chersina TaxID=47854 RepID=UPI0033DFC10D
MTIFGSIMESETAVPTLGVVDSPVRPKLLAEPGNRYSSKTDGPRSLNDDDVDELVGAWKQSVMREFHRARELAEAHQGAMTALARLAEAALLADEREVALQAAIQTLDIGASRLDESSQNETDLPATHVALQVLLCLDQARFADKYLQQMANLPELVQIRATVLIGEARYDEALAVLSGMESHLPGVASMRGYILLLREEFGKAIKELRAAHRVDPNDVDSILNLAAGLWHVNSRRKAIRWARFAAAIAPGRHDAHLALIRYLIEAGSLDLAEVKIRSLVDRGVVQTSSLVVLQAQIAAARDQVSRVDRLLRRARALAEEEKDEVASSELDARIAISEHMSAKIDRVETLQRIRSACRKAPKSAFLVAMLANFVDRASNATEVEHALAQLEPGGRGWTVRSAQCRLAFLKGDFDTAVELALAWSHEDPYNENAVKLYAFWYGALHEDWSAAAGRCLDAIDKLGISKTLANPAAYSLALAGRGRDALELLSQVDTSHFVLMATKGLACISAGDVSEGLSLYRQAAQIADRQERGLHNRLLMTIHQAMGLRRLAVVSTQPGLVRAAALPAVELPRHWQDIAEIRFLAEVAKRRGWSWPVMID